MRYLVRRHKRWGYIDSGSFRYRWMAQLVLWFVECPMDENVEILEVDDE